MISQIESVLGGPTISEENTPTVRALQVPFIAQRHFVADIGRDSCGGGDSSRPIVRNKESVSKTLWKVS